MTKIQALAFQVKICYFFRVVVSRIFDFFDKEWAFPLFCFMHKMDVKSLEVKVRELIGPVAGDVGVELYDVELKKAGRKFLLRVFIEKEGGVTVGDCERVSRGVAAVLDVEDPMPYSYTLEVSSPGLDRALRKPADFRKFTGKTARVVTTSPIENQTFFIGEIIDAGDNGIVLLLPKDKEVKIPYEHISRARLEVKI
ncbi:MAG TPA: ribosome maturation factor RimP [Nitrospirae bacterium]|nr:ribosome maturation factor RimP [bacterium BMS3Abin10]GBE38543.1 ribosome maturation factor RimP [bacterium BMS3Bbin08]HDH50151.1 ribosome maturation factor RimP [Nitrospirota bacterium]HDK16620.1 ribosome maturation factor RimP [Nitrospirota bacterium]HDK81886.1 ribosome maturation factor RimP [Nitrospirota bacterium]